MVPALRNAPQVKQHVPVTDFETLGHAMLGEFDYSWEMRLVCEEWRAEVLNGLRP